MNKKEATSLLKEVYGTCDNFGEQGVIVMPPNDDDVLSKGYQLHIKAWK